MDNINNNNEINPTGDISSGFREYHPEVIKKYDFTRREIIMAFIAIVLGFGFIKLTVAPLIADGRMGLGTMVILLAFTFFGIVFPAQRNKSSVGKCIRIALCILFSVNIFISSNLLIQFLDAVFVLMILAYDKLSDSDEKYQKIRKMLPSDMFGAMIILPFYDYGACHAAVKASADKTKAGSGLKNAALGLAIAIPSTVVVAVLLASADSGFKDIIDSLLSDSFRKIIVFIVQILIGLPVAYYIYGLCRSSEKKYSSEAMNDEYCLKTVRSLRFLPSVAGVFSALPVCILYVIFFFSQLSYFLASFASELPAGMSSYAEYARRGFFELCMVSVINLAIIAAINLFCKYQTNGKRPMGLRIMSCVLSVFTVLLIATAVSKMVMYINVYGLTPLRVYTTWFMLLLAVVFIGIILAVANSKINLPKIIVTAFTIMFTTLSFCNIDGIIAEYNADRYINGTLNEFDVDMLNELSTGAVPSAMKAEKYLNGKGSHAEFEAIISDKLKTVEEGGLRTLTVSDIIARDAYKANDDASI